MGKRGMFVVEETDGDDYLFVLAFFPYADSSTAGGNQLLVCDSDGYMSFIQTENLINNYRVLL